MTPDIVPLCGDNRECIFDVQQTGNTELGEQTKGFEEDNQAAVDELGKLLQAFSYKLAQHTERTQKKDIFATYSLNRIN